MAGLHHPATGVTPTCTPTPSARTISDRNNTNDQRVADPSNDGLALPTTPLASACVHMLDGPFGAGHRTGTRGRSLHDIMGKHALVLDYAGSSGRGRALQVHCHACPLNAPHAPYA